MHIIWNWKSQIEKMEDPAIWTKLVIFRNLYIADFHPQNHQKHPLPLHRHVLGLMTVL